MALLVRGKSTCHLCGQVIGPEDAAEMFPPALCDSREPVARLNDAAVHRVCLLATPFGADALVRRDEYVGRLGPGLGPVGE